MATALEKAAIADITKNKDAPTRFVQIIKSSSLYKFLVASTNSVESNSGTVKIGSKEIDAIKVSNPAIAEELRTQGKMIVKTKDGTYFIGPRPEKAKGFTKKNNSKGKPTQKVNRSNPVPSANNTPSNAVLRAAQIVRNQDAQSQPKVKRVNRAEALNRLAAVSAQGTMAPTRPEAEAEIKRSNSEKFVLINEQGYKNLLGLINTQGVTPEKKGFITIEGKETQAQECTVKLLNFNNKILVRLRPFRKELEKYYYIGPASGFKEVEEWPTEETPVNSYRPSGVARPALSETKKGKLSLQERRNRGEFGALQKSSVTQKPSSVNVRAFGTFAGKSFAKTQKNKGQKTYTASRPLGAPSTNSRVRATIEREFAEISAFPAQDAVDKARAFFIKQGIPLNNLVINRLLSRAYNTEQFSEPTEREGIREWIIQRLLAKPYEKIRNNALEKMITAEATEREKNRFSDLNPTIGEIKEAIKRENKTANAYVSEKEKKVAPEEAKQQQLYEMAVKYFSERGLNLKKTNVKEAIRNAIKSGTFVAPVNSYLTELKLTNSEKQARNNKLRDKTIKEKLEYAIEESSNKWVEIPFGALKTAISSNARENAGTDITITVNGKPITGKKIELMGRLKSDFNFPDDRLIVSGRGQNNEDTLKMFMGPKNLPIPVQPNPKSHISLGNNSKTLADIMASNAPAPANIAPFLPGGQLAHLALDPNTPTTPKKQPEKVTTYGAKDPRLLLSLGNVNRTTPKARQTRRNNSNQYTPSELLNQLTTGSSTNYIEITDRTIKMALSSNVRENVYAGNPVTIIINGAPVSGTKVEFKGRVKIPKDRSIVSVRDSNGLKLFIGPSNVPAPVAATQVAAPVATTLVATPVATQVATTQVVTPVGPPTSTTPIQVQTPIPVQNQTKIQVYRHSTGEVYDTAFHGSDYNYELLSSTGWFSPDDSNSPTASYIIDINGNTMQEYTLPEANFEGGTRRRRKHHRKSKKRITKKRR